MNREKLKRVVESIEAAEKAIKTYSDHKREIYTTNKDEFEPKVLRKIIARRKMDPDSRTKDDDLLDQYETALGMVGELAKAAASGDLTYQEAADEAHVSRRTMARHVARVHAVPEPTDHGATPNGEADATVSSVAVEQVSAAPAPPANSDDLAAEAERLGLTAVVRDLQALHDDLTIPAHLRRERATA